MSDRRKSRSWTPYDVVASNEKELAVEHVDPTIRSILYVDLGRNSVPPQAFLDVARLARHLRASLTLWDAPADEGRLRRGPRPGRPKNRRHLADQRIEATTARFANWRSSVDRSVRTTTTVATGRWSDELSTELESGRHDLVVVLGRGGSPAIRRIRRLVRTCSLPLLVVLGPLDSGVVAEVRADDRLQLNARVVRLASAVARGMRCDASFVCPLDTDAADIGEVQRTLHELVANVGDVDHATIIVQPGRSVDLAVEHALAHGADLVVIAGSGHFGTKSKLLGNAAEQLLSKAMQSVLIVSPNAAARNSRTERQRPNAR